VGHLAIHTTPVFLPHGRSTHNFSRHKMTGSARSQRRKKKEKKRKKGEGDQKKGKEGDVEVLVDRPPDRVPAIVFFLLSKSDRKTEKVLSGKRNKKKKGKELALTQQRRQIATISAFTHIYIRPLRVCPVLT